MMPRGEVLGDTLGWQTYSGFRGLGLGKVNGWLCMLHK